ncbi:AEC family transporter [Clostridium aminobutyricum]|uniref:AEC family transporter n=1 Tax=Clostridium aminobutyricum TaxID=33953 RepID=A0A939D939_CLOAM|nr:AEC family transporter [Clostridium aminobutyricum]MBN7772983.1 AEC family transporter [Clostridium aminobutyricum]
MIIIFAKILSVFSISLIGYAANKLKWMPIESNKYFSVLLINISSPCLIIYSMSQQEMSEETLTSVVQTASLMLLALITATVISIYIAKVFKFPQEDRGVYRALLVLTNNGFMGYPLSLAVFGEKGLFLMIVANAVFTIYLYSAGVMVLISGKGGKLDLKSALKSIFSIPVVSSVIGLLIFIFGIQIPSLLGNFLNTVGAITIPLSMLIIGIQLAESKAREILANKHLFITLILKLILFPVLLFALLVWLPFRPLVFCIVIFAMAMPSAAVIPVLAEIYGSNAKLAAQVVFITTMFSLITLPIFGILLTSYIGK